MGLYPEARFSINSFFPDRSPIVSIFFIVLLFWCPADGYDPIFFLFQSVLQMKSESIADRFPIRLLSGIIDIDQSR